MSADVQQSPEPVENHATRFGENFSYAVPYARLGEHSWPPLSAPPKRDAALAGAHKSPTKLDGVVHKKTRAVTTPSNAVAAST